MPNFADCRRVHYTTGRKAWTGAYRSWLSKLHLDEAFEEAVFDDSLLAVEQIDARISALDRKLEALAPEPAYRPWRGSS